ncbi:winged helix-turn-helix domain-containing protein [Streptomyces macrosporus]|uniref:HTH arsR-type domain-containing protein n=1 Tax=Streptomyces macrosporus TaxID=44032 RepID=A0ABN3KBP0_9ACTN
MLSVTMASGIDADLYLEGQGLLLVPSVFGTDAPVIIPDAQPQPVLFYPASSDSTLPDIVRPRTVPPATLAQLLGRTRAAILLTVADRAGCTTTELPTTAGVSVSTASEHASVLRQAGLIATTRHHKAVLHTVTPTGLALVNTA